MSQSLNIAVLLPDLRGGGAERIRLDLAHEFKRRGHRVEFVLMNAHGEYLPEALGSFRVIDLGINRFRQLPTVLAKHLYKEKPDAVMAAMWPLTIVAPIVVAAMRHRCRTVVSEHGIISAQYAKKGKLHRLFLRQSTAIGYRLADARVGVSAGVVTDIAALAGMRREAFTVINNPVPTRLKPSEKEIEEAEKKWGCPRGGRVVAVARLKAVKNFPMLLNAFARIPRPDARMMFVGDGPERQRLQAITKELEIEDRVIFAGFHHDPTVFYHTADVFALTSNYEGFGNVLVEAMSCGTSVVATDCPAGPAEILENGKYGRLVPVGDYESFAEALEETLIKPQDPVLLQRRALDFLPEKAADAYLELLQGSQLLK